MRTTSNDALQVRLTRSRRLNVALIAVVAFLAVLLIAQSSNPRVTAQSTGTTTQASDPATSSTTETNPVLGEPAFVLGSADAAVVMVEWTDFRCPYCALFVKQTLPDLISQYVDSGQVRLEVHDVSFFGTASTRAAAAARAAGEQGRYREFLETLYNAAPESGHPAMPVAKLIRFAESAGVADIDAFTDRLDDEDLLQQVTSSSSTATSIGVTSVPFFLIGDATLSGAQPISVFQSTIEAQLQSAE